MKQVLILGGSGGIGNACAKIFKEHAEYRVTSVQRQKSETSISDKTIYGDLRSVEFRRELVLQTTPAIVVATFGRHPSNETPMSETLNEFVLSVIELFEAFETQGTVEHFVVVSSLSAQTNVLPSVFMESASYKYICAKRMLSDFFRQAQLYRKSKTKIVLVEPGFVRTNFANINARLVSANQSDILTRAKIEPLDPTVVASAIFQAVSESKRPSCSLTLYNSASI